MRVINVVRVWGQWILSPLCLPIPPSRQQNALQDFIRSEYKRVT